MDKEVLGRRRRIVPLLAMLFGVAPAGLAVAELPQTIAVDNRARPASQSRGADTLDADQLAARIDGMFDARWQKAKIVPAPLADDAEFARRVFLDLAGRIPSVGEVRSFLEDRDTGKRKALVEELLGRGTFPAHFAAVWRELLMPGASQRIETRAVVPGFEAWLRLRFAEKTPYDRMVTEMLTARAPPGTAANPNANAAAPSPLPFYVVNERKPENLAASVSRIFLGLQVQCAQCHDHPHAAWKQDQFWSFAAFFKGADGAEGLLGKPTDGSIEIPGTGKFAPAVFLDGVKAERTAGAEPRELLAKWITTPTNPFFARATVNRVWSVFFGRGLVDPVDDMEPSNPPSQPEALAELARQFIANNHDLAYLVRAITATNLYQRSSRGTHDSQDDPREFARMPLRPLSSEQIFSILVEATNLEPRTPRVARRNSVDDGTAKARFLSRFGDTLAGGEYQASIPQALTMMNGALIADATKPSSSGSLRGVLEAPFLDDDAKIETLFLATLSRAPTTVEMAEMKRHLGSYPEKTRGAGFADIFWALLNSSEFLLNH